MNVDELIHEIEQLTLPDKWRLLKKVLDSLEDIQIEKAKRSDWHDFLRETYGSSSDTPIQRWEHDEYEEREPSE